MAASDLKTLWKGLNDALYVGFHDGLLDVDKMPWEQDDKAALEAWRRITHPDNRDALRAQLGTGGNPDGERMIQEACREACRRAESK